MNPQNTRTIFSTAKQLVEMMEDQLLGSSKAPVPWIARIRKEFFQPHFYIVNGMEFLLQNFMKIIFYIPLIVSLTIFTTSKLGLPKQQIDTYSIISMIGAILIVLFALPSTLCHFGIKERNVEFVTKYLISEGFTKEELTAISSNLAAFEECAMNRVKTLRWTMATLWGAFLYGYSQSLGVITRIAEKDEVVSLIGKSLTPLTIAGLLAIVTLATIAGYKRSNHMVFQGLQFACTEASSQLSCLANKQTSPT